MLLFRGGMCEAWQGWLQTITLKKWNIYILKYWKEIQHVSNLIIFLYVWFLWYMTTYFKFVLIWQVESLQIFWGCHGAYLGIHLHVSSYFHHYFSTNNWTEARFHCGVCVSYQKRSFFPSFGPFFLQTEDIINNNLRHCDLSVFR